MDFLSRSYEKELLDRTDIPFDAIDRNMYELDVINTWLGGHAISVAGLKKLIGNRREMTICEIGCGGGDNLIALRRYCQRRGIKVRFTGIDINPHCIAVARKKLTGAEASFLTSDYLLAHLGDEKPDVVYSSLFCHHFTDQELVTMLRWMRDHCRIGFFINDLHRHPLAYHSIRLLTTLFSRSWLVKNDAPLSVLRGFRRAEWKSLLQQAAITDYSLSWKWAFRWLIISEKGTDGPRSNIVS
jgi:2-polyprenyl-3-methyl-5-hydroxy-6-metoxy-1,4-benzoquinol methylase